jgi:hypothetical protein
VVWGRYFRVHERGVVGRRCETGEATLINLNRTMTAAILGVGACVALSSETLATELIVNGGFETGDFTGWTVTDIAGGSGSFFVVTGTSTPLSLLDTVGAASGAFYAVSDQTGPGTHALTQAFTVAPGMSSVLLTFQMFVNNANALAIIDAIGLDHDGPDNQHGRVDLLTGAASAFDTGAGVLANFYLGSDTGANPSPYSSYVFDLTALTAGGGTFQLRFAETDNQTFFNLGVDNVSIVATASDVPAPASIGLFGVAAAGLLAWRRRAA